MPVLVFECDSSESDALKKALEYDPYLDKETSPEELKRIAVDKSANIIFARQAYDLRNGASFGLDPKKYYLYIKASEEFLRAAEEKLKKNFKTVKVATKEEERKVVDKIDDEESRVNSSIGAIFGG